MIWQTDIRASRAAIIEGFCPGVAGPLIAPDPSWGNLAVGACCRCIVCWLLIDDGLNAMFFDTTGVLLDSLPEFYSLGAAATETALRSQVNALFGVDG